MTQTYLYQIGILYFADNIKRVQSTLCKMLETDGYHIGVWRRKETANEDDNVIDIYSFIRSQCEYTVIFVTPECSEDPLFLQALRTQIQQKELNEDRRFLAVECGKKLPAEYQAKVNCLDAGAACSVELAMQIEEFFYPKRREKKESGRVPSAQNMVVADVIKNSKFF